MMAVVAGRYVATANSVGDFARTDPARNTRCNRHNRVYRRSARRLTEVFLAVKRYLCKVFRYNHTHGENAQREREAWRNVPLEPAADVGVTGSSMRDAAAFAYVLTHGLDFAMQLRSMNALDSMIRAELDIAGLASSLVEEQCWAGPCLLLERNPFELFYMVVTEFGETNGANRGSWPT
jgi:hypothetical protein